MAFVQMVFELGDNDTGGLIAADSFRFPLRLEIRRADPRILIADSLLRLWRAGSLHPDVILDGDVLTISAVNQRVVYRITERVPVMMAWEAVWPD